MALRVYQGIPWQGNLPLRCQTPVDYLRSMEVVCGRFVVGGSKECGRGRSRGKKSLRFAGRARHCAGAVLQGH
jgi:hypothetical protein